MHEKSIQGGRDMEKDLNLPYSDAGFQVVENSGFQCEGLTTHYRIRQGEIYKERLEGSDGHCW